MNMLCRKKRFYKTKYCSNDFQHTITLYKKSILNETKFTQIDAVQKVLTSFTILANVKINNFDIESAGELLRAGSTIDIITYYQGQPLSENGSIAVYEDIKANGKNWYVNYIDHQYQVLDIELMNGQTFFNLITAQRVS